MYNKNYSFEITETYKSTLDHQNTKGKQLVKMNTILV